MYLPFPGTTAASTVRSSPPTSVHARPLTRPTVLFFSASPCLNFLTPKNSSRLEGFISIFLDFLPKRSFFTTLRYIFEISLSKFLTPASLV